MVSMNAADNNCCDKRKGAKRRELASRRSSCSMGQLPSCAAVAFPHYSVFSSSKDPHVTTLLFFIDSVYLLCMCQPGSYRIILIHFLSSNLGTRSRGQSVAHTVVTCLFYVISPKLQLYPVALLYED